MADELFHLISASSFGLFRNRTISYEPKKLNHVEGSKS